MSRAAFLGAIPALAIGMHDWMELGWTLQGLSLLAVVHAVFVGRTRDVSARPQGEASTKTSAADLTEPRSASASATAALLTGAIGVTVTLFAIAAAIVVQLAMARHAAGSDIGAASPWALGAAHTGWLVAPLLAVFARRALLRTQGTIGLAWVGAAFVSVLLIVSLIAIEGRGRRAIEYEALATDGLQPWRSAIPHDASVFWPDRMPAVWFGLERRSHASFIQLAGIVFNRSSMIVAERLERAPGLAGAELPIDFRARANAADHAEPTERDLIDACSDRDLDFVVLDTRFERFSPHPHIQRVDRRDFHLHDCNRVREGAARRDPADQDVTRPGTAR
jgi:hypothetical protein